MPTFISIHYNCCIFMNEIELLKNISMSEWKAHARVLCCTAINRTILLLISLVLINI